MPRISTQEVKQIRTQLKQQLPEYRFAVTTQPPTFGRREYAKAGVGVNIHLLSGPALLAPVDAQPRLIWEYDLIHSWGSWVDLENRCIVDSSGKVFGVPDPIQADFKKVGSIAKTAPMGRGGPNDEGWVGQHSSWIYAEDYSVPSYYINVKIGRRPDGYKVTTW